ncbi:15249_t:CDS:2, partial [Cetraspora pellucida]
TTYATNNKNAIIYFTKELASLLEKAIVSEKLRKLHISNLVKERERSLER